MHRAQKTPFTIRIKQYSKMTLTVLAWPKERNQRENPYNYLVYRGMSDAVEVCEFNFRKFDVKGADILHVHWPERILDDKRRWRLRWRFWRFLSAVDRLHKKGGKLVWTVHNLRSREVKFPDLAESLLKKLIAKVDGFIFLSKLSQSLFEQTYGPVALKQTAVIAHPHYCDVYKNENKEVARAKHGISGDALVLGFFGKIRPNKGLERLLDAFAKIDRTNNLILLIAGSADKRGISSALVNKIENDKRVKPLVRYIQPEEVGSVVASCDALIFPYHEILNSGSSLLALSLGRPVIVPNMGSFPELNKTLGEEWVYLYEDPIDSKKLQSALNWLTPKNYQHNKLPDMSFADPVKVAKETEAFYKMV